MGFHETFTCPDCGFEYTDDHALFFYKHDSKETIEFIHLFSTVGISDGSKIKGTIVESYCKHCNKFIRTFYIEEVNCPQYDSEEIIDIVKAGIKNCIKRIKNETMNKVNELNEIKARNKYTIEKKPYSLTPDVMNYLANLSEKEQEKFLEGREDIYVNYVELEYCDYTVTIQDFDSEKEAIEYCKRHAYGNFIDELDREISWNKNYLKRILNYIYRVEYWNYNEDENISTILCPKCGNGVYKFIDKSYPCPNCEGKLIHTQTILSD